MSVVVLSSWAGSPGVTTTAVGLTLAWPRPVLLCDGDPGAYQAILAGYLKGQERSGKGLLRVAEAHRDHRPLREVIMDQTIALTEDPEHRKVFLPGFSRPGSARLFDPVWPELMDAFRRLGDVGVDVIIDCGRIGAQGLPHPVIEFADLVCLLTQTGLRTLAAARMHAPTLLEQNQLLGAENRLGLMLVGEGRPYRRREVSSLLGMTVLATLPLDHQAAAVFSEGAARPRRFESAPLVKALHGTASFLSARLRQQASLIEAG